MKNSKNKKTLFILNLFVVIALFITFYITYTTTTQNAFALDKTKSGYTLTEYVTDTIGLLPPPIKYKIENDLEALGVSSGTQIALLIIPTTSGVPIEQFALKTAELSKLGRKKVDDWVLMVVAKEDRKVRIEVGYGAEGVVTDVLSDAIIRKIILPEFKADNYSKGIEAGITALIKVIKQEPIGVSLAGKEVEVPYNPEFSEIFPFLIFISFMVCSFLHSNYGKTVASVGGGALTALITSFATTLPISLLLGVFVGIIFYFQTNRFGKSYRSGGIYNVDLPTSGGWGQGSSSGSSSPIGFGSGRGGGGGASGSW